MLLPAAVWHEERAPIFSPLPAFGLAFFSNFWIHSNNKYNELFYSHCTGHFLVKNKKAAKCRQLGNQLISFAECVSKSVLLKEYVIGHGDLPIEVG